MGPYPGSIVGSKTSVAAARRCFIRRVFHRLLKVLAGSSRDDLRGQVQFLKDESEILHRRLWASSGSVWTGSSWCGVGIWITWSRSLFSTTTAKRPHPLLDQRTPGCHSSAPNRSSHFTSLAFGGRTSRGGAGTHVALIPVGGVMHPSVWTHGSEGNIATVPFGSGTSVARQPLVHGAQRLCVVQLAELLFAVRPTSATKVPQVPMKPAMNPAVSALWTSGHWFEWTISAIGAK
jgi:hypothetical protein